MHFLNLGIQMAKRMGLFGLKGVYTLGEGNREAANDSARARAQTAWGRFQLGHVSLRLSLWTDLALIGDANKTRSLMFQEEELGAKYSPTCEPLGRKMTASAAHHFVSLIHI